jgi:protein O-GlcNAc transferase
MQSVFRFHNADRFEIFCYATTASDGSAYRTKIELEAHHFVDVSLWPTQAVVERISSDGIHIRECLNYAFAYNLNNIVGSDQPKWVHQGGSQ